MATPDDLRAEIERLRHQLDEAQKLAHFGSWEWEPKSDRVALSSGMTVIAGVTSKDFDGRLPSLLKCVPTEDVDRVRSEVKALRDLSAPVAIDVRFLRPDGATRFLHLEGRATLDDNGKVTRVAGIAQDVTNLRFAEQSLRQLTGDLMRSNEELEQFAYVASHDLREPLRIVSGYLGILSRRYSALLPTDGQNYVKAAVEGASRMEQLISHLLEYSRVGTRGGDLIETSAEEALGFALSNLRVTIAESDAKVTHGPMPAVIADQSQLTQLFQNLIENAVKFRGKDPPKVRITAERKGTQVVIAVQDNGIGIDPKDHSRVFELFQRLHPPQEYPGAGLGLAIAKKIVERHGGQIWVESAPGDGAKFLFTLTAAD